MKPKPPLEREVQRRVVALYKSAGCTVYSLSQGYRPGGAGHGTTRQTKGLPDLYVFPPSHHAVRGVSPWWHEVKRPGGKQTPEQREFEDLCFNTLAVDYVLGGYREALAYLIRQGLWTLPEGTTLDMVAPDA